MVSPVSRFPVCIKSEDSCVMWDMPLGKIGKDGRLTVQKEQKGKTCSFYAVKRILTTEQIRSPHGAQCSLLRKTITETTSDRRMSLEAIDKAHAEADEIFLRSKGLDPKKVKTDYVSEIIRSRMPGVSFGSLDPRELETLADVYASKALSKSTFMRAAVSQVIVRDHGLKEVLYKDLMTVEKLINVVKAKGPLVIHGQFGVSFYLGHRPVKFEGKFGEYDLYGWRKGTPTAGEDGIIHAVVIVGAEVKEGREFVYWMDPSDSNDPSIPGGQRRYVSSFQSTLSRIYSAAGQTLVGMIPPVKALIGVALYNPLFRA